MKNKFVEVMSNQTDDQLIAILTVKRADYIEEALLAAQDEFDKRQIPKEKIEQIKKEQIIIHEKNTEIANEPLERDIKNLAIIFPIIARLMYTQKFKAGGYDRKLLELSNAFFIGRLLYLGLIILVIIIFNFII